MSPRGSESRPGTFSRAIADAIDHAIGKSGRSVSDVISAAGMSRNYYYKRTRYELSFTTDDIAKVAESIGTTPDAIVSDAISRSATSNVIVGRFGQDEEPYERTEAAHELIEDDGADNFD